MSISKEFIPKWFRKQTTKYRCPICQRPHYKEPGPFTYGITNNMVEGKLSLWVESFGCCGTIQEFPYESIEDQSIKVENINPILKKVFGIK